MSYSASFNGRPLTSNFRSSAKKTVKSDVPARTPGYYNILKNAKGSSNAFARAIVVLAKESRH